MSRGLYVLIILGIIMHIALLPAPAQEKPTHEKAPTPPAVTDDALRLLQLGQGYMGQNNPHYAARPAQLDPNTRNEAGDQALRIFREVTTRYPKYGDGWLWLGIALTETLRYSEKMPAGESTRNAKSIADGLRAFRTACDCKPDDVLYAIYYGEALMAYCEDFDGARRFWEEYAKNARTDLQRVLALTQSARACLNKAHFGKIAGTLTAQEARQQFANAEQFVQQAAKICPQAQDVKAMQALLEQYRTIICGK